MSARTRAATARRLERASGGLAIQALTEMEQTLPWFAGMPAETRAWIGLVAQAGIAAFVVWFRNPDGAVEIRGEVFGAAPRELARAVTLQQTVDMVRVTIGVVESSVDELASPGEEIELREAVLRYSREIAFAAAQIYAGAAEERGAWDARLEALVVDALVRDESDDALRSRAAALGWTNPGAVAVLAGHPPDAEPEAVVDALHRAAKHAGLDLLAGVAGDRLVTVVGRRTAPETKVSALLPEFGAGPVVVGPTVPDLLSAARSTRVALAGLRAAPAWPGAPRLVRAADLLPERALGGDPEARRALVEEIYKPVIDAGGALEETVAAYLEHGGALEATPRSLFVHPNTVRYRLKRVAEITGYTPVNPRQQFCVQVALALGRLDAADPDL